MRLRLNSRIGSNVAVAIATLVVVLAVSWRAVDSAIQEARDIRERLGPVVAVTGEMLLAVEQMENAEFLYFERSGDAARKLFDENAEAFERARDRIDTLVASPRNESRAADIHKTYREFLVLDGRLRELLRAGRVAEARRFNVTRSLIAAAKLREAIRLLRTVGLKGIEDAQIHVEQTMQEAERQLLAASLLGILIGCILWWRQSRMIVAPLAALGHATRRLAGGRFDRLDHPEARHTVEIDQLQTDFNLMATQLEAMTGDLESANDSLEAKVALRTAELEQAKAGLEASVKQLESLDKTKSDLMSVMSHELLTPINFITAYATTLEDGALGAITPAQERALAKIVEGADRLTRIVRNVLDYTRLEGGYAAIMPEVVDLPALLADAMAAARPEAAARGIALELGGTAEVPGVWADPTRAFQVVSELLDNAIKFSPDESRIEVAVTADGDAVTTEIRDSGPGLAPGQSANLFKPFYQADPTSTRKYGGVGLGLAISQRLVRAMGGTISISGGSGAGTAVRFTLPVAEAGVALARTARPEA